MKKRKGKWTQRCIFTAIWFVFLCAAVVFTSGNVQAAGKINLKKAEFKLSKSIYMYNGKSKKPSVRLKYRNKKLVLGKDYSVIYAKGRKNAGAYRVTVKGKGRCKGVVHKTFTIVPAKTSIVSVTRQGDASSLKVVWKKQAVQTSGYQLRYSVNKNMKKALFQKVYNKNRTSSIVSAEKLKEDTRYYMQVRTFCIVKGRTYYSAWSPVKAEANADPTLVETKVPVSPVPGETEVPVSPVPGETEVPVSPTPDEFCFLFEDSANVSAVIGNSILFQTNHTIKDIEIVPEGVLLASSKEQWSENCYLYAHELGTATVTFTDTYGQKMTSNVSVTQDISLRDGSKICITSSCSDETLPVPEVESIYYGKSYITVCCPGEFTDTDPYYGYEIYLSETENFDNNFLVGYMDSQWKYTGCGKVDYSDIRTGMTYYLKTRSYTVSGSTKVCSPWSAVRQIDVADFTKPQDSLPAYSYELYYVESMGSELYTRLSRTVYIKTENPDPCSINLYSGDKNALSSAEGHPYWDIKYLKTSDYNERLKKVEGGYIGFLEFMSSGSHTVEIRECSLEGYSVAKTVTFDVKDYNEAQNAWVDDIIGECTTPDMTPFEKMNAVSIYLTEPGRFKYLTSSNGRMVSLAAIPNGPYFKSYRWDSYGSPGMLCEFAARIGGFDDIHNCYWDYPRGSNEWKIYHHYVKLTIGEETKLYTVCPAAKTGDIGEIQYIDFSDVSSLYPAGS